jgi:teichuronic acid biosynthesis glycosyltransferase TuaC
MIRTLLFSTLYPNSVRPSHGIFVETCVIAPVPRFSFRHKMFGENAQHAVVPLQEERNGIHIEHPRYLLLPKIGMNTAPYTLARTGLAAAKRLIDFDLIDAHYFYPDGVAATIIDSISPGWATPSVWPNLPDAIYRNRISTYRAQTQ